ncbi:hypothetical protein BSFA1_77230 (plasmid) [Burkholderia sp. SFA1]|nr:hypothetical protein BG58_06855 [Caballeronia jiangsuensis]KXV14778.1 hypothetical protein CR51_03850 [Caballeronia megalochromosomata]BBQ02595.1 hypothetical protein BSFA1_77230 [Burkholderia sp. SFA1]
MVPYHNEVDIQFLREAGDLIHGVSNCEVAGRRHAELRQFVHSFTQYFFRRHLLEIEGNCRNSVKTSCPRRIVYHGKKMRFSAKLSRKFSAKTQRTASFSCAVVAQ